MGVFFVAGKTLERARQKYRSWLREGEEIAYPNHFCVPLAV